MTQKQKYTDLLIKVSTYVFLVWIVFLLGKAIWENWNLRNSIIKLTDQMVTLENQEKDLQNLLLYYSSDTFKELEARRRLGYKKPGEKMVILAINETTKEKEVTQPTPTNFIDEVRKEKEAIKDKSNSNKNSNLQLWWKYFTK